MTLSIGDHIGKLHAEWKQDEEGCWGRVFPEPSRLADGELSREFEITTLVTDGNGNVVIIAKTVK